VDGGAFRDAYAIHSSAALAVQILDKLGISILQDPAMFSGNLRMIHHKTSLSSPTDHDAGRLNRLSARGQPGQDGDFKIQAH